MNSFHACGKKIAGLVLVIGLFILLATPLRAVIIKGGNGGNGADSLNITAPTDLTGDPGWDNVGLCPYGSGVYLGSGWVLTAWHTHAFAVQYSIPQTATIKGHQYSATGTGYRLNDPGTGQPADLYLFQIDETQQSPNLASVAISDTALSSGAALRAIGCGLDRATGTTPTQWDSLWRTPPQGPVTHSGFYHATTESKRWGDNAVTGTAFQLDYFYGPTHWFYTTFDQGAGDNEFQAANHDSGGGVFYKNGSYWQLAGILDAANYLIGASQSAAVFGDNTFSADLSWYRSQIVTPGRVQVFQIASQLDTPSAAMGSGWASVQLVGDAGFGAATGTWSLPIDTNSHTFTVDTGASTVTIQPGSGTATGIISGGGNLLKKGAGTLVLSAANAYSGSTSIEAGVLQLAGGNNRLPAGTALSFLNVGGAALNLNNLEQTIGSLSGGGPLGGNVTLGSGKLTVGNSSSTIYSGAISGAGGKLVKTGTGMLTINGANTYTGNTSLAAGTLSFGNGSLNSTSQVVFTGNSTLQWSGHNQDLSGRLKINDNVTATFDTNGNDVIFNQPLISGAAQSGSLVKTGPGMLTINGANTYTGNTSLAAGTLSFGNGSLNSTSQVVFTSNSTLQWNGHNQDLSSRLKINDNVTATFDTNGNDVIFNQPLILDALHSGALVKTGAGALTLLAPPVYTGQTTVSGGVLNVGNLTQSAMVSVVGAGSTLNANLIVASTLTIGSPGGASAFDSNLSLPAAGAVPEPGAGLLLVLAAIGLASIRWLRRGK
jgi:autotransporter-associated beta strand protein